MFSRHSWWCINYCLGYLNIDNFNFKLPLAATEVACSDFLQVLCPMQKAIADQSTTGASEWPKQTRRSANLCQCNVLRATVGGWPPLFRYWPPIERFPIRNTGLDELNCMNIKSPARLVAAGTNFSWLKEAVTLTPVCLLATFQRSWRNLVKCAYTYTYVPIRLLAPWPLANEILELDMLLRPLSRRAGRAWILFWFCLKWDGETGLKNWKLFWFVIGCLCSSKLSSGFWFARQ